MNLKSLTRYLWAMCSAPFITGLSAWERLWEAMVMPHPFLSHSSTPVLPIPQSCLEDVTACSINPNSFCSQHYAHFVLKALRQNKLLCLQRLSENAHSRNHADTRKCSSTRGRWVGQGPATLYKPPCSISLCSRGPLIECGEFSFFFCLFLFFFFFGFEQCVFCSKRQPPIERGCVLLILSQGSHRRILLPTHCFICESISDQNSLSQN